MALVADYGSDASSDHTSQEEPVNTSPSAVGVATAEDEASDRPEAEPGESVSGSEDSYFVGSDAESEDSASRRRRLAEERLSNRGEEVSGPAKMDLPPPLEAIGGTPQPAFLLPEATRPLARPFHRSRAPLTKRVEAKPVEEPKGWDIASMAPKLKGDAGKRGPPGAVITAAAKKFKPDDEGGAVVTAAQVAMLGGQWQPSEAAEVAEESQPGPRTGRGKGPSKAMGVSEFLAKGEGATMLPRSKQDRRDKEKDKRSRGQSAINGWKSEAEMVLRQQYD